LKIHLWKNRPLILQHFIELSSINGLEKGSCTQATLRLRKSTQILISPVFFGCTTIGMIQSYSSRVRWSQHPTFDPTLCTLFLYTWGLAGRISFSPSWHHALTKFS
jgi:hypothetical protein